MHELVAHAEHRAGLALGGLLSVALPLPPGSGRAAAPSTPITSMEASQLMSIKNTAIPTLLAVALLLVFAAACYLFVIWRGCGGADDLGSFIDKVRAFHTVDGCTVG